MSTNETYEKIDSISLLKLFDNSDFQSLGVIGGFKYLIFKRPAQFFLFVAAIIVLVIGFENIKLEVKKLWQLSPVDQAVAIVKRQIKSPDSFKKVGGEVLWNGKDSEGLDAHVVSVLFDASNSFGASIRSCMLIAFSKTRDNGVTWDTNVGIADYSDSVSFCNSSTSMDLKMHDVNIMVERNFKVAEKKPAPTKKSQVILKETIPQRDGTSILKVEIIGDKSAPSQFIIPGDAGMALWKIIEKNMGEQVELTYITSGDCKSCVINMEGK